MKTRKTKLQYVLTKNVYFQPCIVGCNSHFIIIFWLQKNSGVWTKKFSGKVNSNFHVRCLQLPSWKIQPPFLHWIWWTHPSFLPRACTRTLLCFSGCWPPLPHHAGASEYLLCYVICLQTTWLTLSASHVLLVNTGVTREKYFQGKKLMLSFGPPPIAS